MSIQSRILYLQKQIKKNRDGKMKVIYHDGHAALVEPGDGIDLVREHANILRFEGGGGMLADLLNGLLDV